MSQLQLLLLYFFLSIFFILFYLLDSFVVTGMVRTHFGARDLAVWLLSLDRTSFMRFPKLKVEKIELGRYETI
jgi:hypothetical protein